MKSFKRALYKFGEIEELKQISCNSNLNVDGQEGIYEVEVTIGTEKGLTGLRYEAFSIPDRFQLFFNGNKVADSKYVGSALSQHKNALLAVNNKVVPIFEYDGAKFVNSGRTEVVTVTNSDIANGTPSEPTAGKGEIKFTKDKAEVTVMKLKVYGVLGSTLWNATPICPNTTTQTNTTTPTSGSTPSGGSTTPKVRTYDLVYHKYISSSACSELEQGTIGEYYSTGSLAKGTKLYTDKQLSKLMPTGFAFLGKTIYEVVKGEIVDIYPCHRATGF
jgi:hypothetical protein